MLAVMLFLGYYGEAAKPVPPSLERSLFLLALRAVALLAAAAIVNRVALSAFNRRRASARRRLASRLELCLRTLLALAYAESLDGTAFPWSAAIALNLDLDGFSPVFQLLGIAPYLLLFLCAWFPMYGFHRAAEPGSWTRGSFLLHKARYNLFLLAAWLPFAFLAEWLSDFLLAAPILLLSAVWSFPCLLARIWGCRPLSDPELLERVRRLESAAGARFSRVYLWEPGGGNVENAAAVGLMRPFRYLFLTPALVRNMDKPELDAVILHELGHVRNRHLVFYFFISMAGVNASILASALAPLSGPGERFALAAVLIFAYFRLVFGWLSRQMERQADWFALDKSGSSSGMINALEKLGLAAGHIRLAGSWHHCGIAERVRALRLAESDPNRIRTHNLLVARLKAIGYPASLVLLASLALASSREGGARKTDGMEAETHWRRAGILFPDDFRPALELARLLAEGGGDRLEALRLAKLADRLADDFEEREAARKLIRKLSGETGS